MKMSRFLHLIFATLILILASSRWSSAQEEKLVLNPPLSQVFPLELKPDGVRLTFPVLLNEHTILGPNVVLRFIYIDPNASLHPRGAGGNGGGQGGGGMGGHHHRGGDSQDGADAGDAGDAYTRSASGSGQGANDVASSLGLLDPNKGPASEARTEVWTQVDLFREALDNAADMGTTVVYSSPDKPKTLSTTIDLPDGMLLGEVAGHVQVLGLTDDSEASSSGVRPQDEIRSFAGHAPVTSLHDFVRTYFEVKEASQKSGKPFSVEVWRPSESKLMTIQIGAPSLPTLF